MSVAPENNFATGQVHYLSDYITRDHSPENAFASLIQKGNVIIDFYADWCGPCKRLGTVLQEIAPVNLNVLIIKVDTDAYQTIAAQYNVRSLPTMIFFKNGRQIHRVTGFNSKAELASLINNLY
jgi:thioredoxin